MPVPLSAKVISKIREYTHAMARELKVIGLMNAQFAVKGDQVYVLEVNPRASRTVPFVSKAIAVPLAKLAAKVMAGKTLKKLGFVEEIWPRYWAVKESVFPFNRFQGQDILLSPEMRSTGEVMGLDADLGIAYAKSQMAAGGPLPMSGRVFISVSDAHKKEVAGVARLAGAGRRVDDAGARRTEQECARRERGCPSSHDRPPRLAARLRRALQRSPESRG